jgi:hypothetical protein
VWRRGLDLERETDDHRCAPAWDELRAMQCEEPLWLQPSHRTLGRPTSLVHVPRTAGPAVGRRNAERRTAHDDFELSWQQIVTAVAAAAGGAAWVSVVGSGVVALRLREAELPVEPVVALMSNEHRFAIGAGILVAPFFAGLIACIADWALAGDPDKLSHRKRQGLAVAMVISGLALAYFVLDLAHETIVTEGVLVLIAVVLALSFLKNEPEIRHTFREVLVIFLAVLVAAGIGAVLAEAWRTPSFDEVRITVHDQGRPVVGGYVTSTDHVVVVATKCGVIEAVPRTEITRIIVGPGPFPTPKPCPNERSRGTGARTALDESAAVQRRAGRLPR